MHQSLAAPLQRVHHACQLAPHILHSAGCRICSSPIQGSRVGPAQQDPQTIRCHPDDVPLMAPHVLPQGSHCEAPNTEAHHPDAVEQRVHRPLGQDQRCHHSVAHQPNGRQSRALDAPSRPLPSAALQTLQNQSLWNGPCWDLSVRLNQRHGQIARSVTEAWLHRCLALSGPQRQCNRDAPRSGCRQCLRRLRRHPFAFWHSHLQPGLPRARPTP
mmetsp:Transcript_7588/g.14081  ORF Transcript_7588/g.14081 Transcript_7588/m.14081 type:complete len:215 (+) Transcript_7588:360-1004(+)